MSNSTWKKLTVYSGVTAMLVMFGGIFILGENTPRGFTVVDADPVLLAVLVPIISILGFITLLGIMRSMMGNKMNAKTVLYTIVSLLILFTLLEISHFFRETGWLYNMVTDR
ncbi:hypothetical protein SAMN04487944_11655 [Gracilibacillus ureilyticus]|uniref:Uncharacterized protein n=1 Tax=Gracilibacillus ureilyticus TaxID=531814 RepID=A0A1H9U6M1_9BACI|nr:hypothetical protein [Gracilibacillus ureilyticus]SES05126.1 hypothetical protein SAMN04487944_11655 [Gracilibacillus ureilyticus]